MDLEIDPPGYSCSPDVQDQRARAPERRANLVLPAVSRLQPLEVQPDLDPGAPQSGRQRPGGFTLLAGVAEEEKRGSGFLLGNGSFGHR